MDADYLENIGRNAFPAVRIPCVKCRQTGVICETVHGIKEKCPDCLGRTVLVREMTAREEHFWIIHLINKLSRNTPLLNIDEL